MLKRSADTLTCEDLGSAGRSSASRAFTGRSVRGTSAVDAPTRETAAIALPLKCRQVLGNVATWTRSGRLAAPGTGRLVNGR